MKDFKELKVWQKTHELTLAIYAASGRFPVRKFTGLQANYGAPPFPSALTLLRDVAAGPMVNS